MSVRHSSDQLEPTGCDCQSQAHSGDHQAQAHTDDWSLLFAGVRLRLRSTALAAAPDNPLVAVLLDCANALDVLQAMREKEQLGRSVPMAPVWRDWGSP